MHANTGLPKTLNIQVTVKEGQMQVSAPDLGITATGDGLARAFENFDEAFSLWVWQKLKAGDLQEDDPTFVEWFGEDGDPTEWIEDHQHQERLTKLVELAQKHFPLLYAEAKSSQVLPLETFLAMNMPHHDCDMPSADGDPDWQANFERWEKMEKEGYAALEKDGPTAPAWLDFCESVGEGWNRREKWTRWGILPKT